METIDELGLALCDNRPFDWDSFWRVHMSESTAPAPVEPTPVLTKWCVVQTGYITPGGDIVSFVDVDGKKFPQLIRVVGESKKALALARRLSGNVSRIAGFNRPDQYIVQPIYGVAEIVVKTLGNKGGRTLTEEQKAKMKAGRRAKGK